MFNIKKIHRLKWGVLIFSHDCNTYCKDTFLKKNKIVIEKKQSLFDQHALGCKVHDVCHQKDLDWYCSVYVLLSVILFPLSDFPRRIQGIMLHKKPSYTV